MPSIRDIPLPGPAIAADILGADKDLGEFLSTAYGPPWNTMNGTGVTAGGTNLQGANGKGKYIVAVDTSVIKLGTKLKINPNPFGDPDIEFLADDTGGAINGKRIDFFDWRGRTEQMKWGERSVNVRESVGGITSAPKDLINAGGDVVDFVGDFVSTILNFRKLGELFAKSISWFLRVLFQAIWTYVLAPWVHWNQRVVTYYWDTYFGDGPTKARGKESVYQKNGGMVTLIFWSIGYAVLWSQAEPDRKLITSARDSMLGRFVRSGEGQVARRNLTAPNKVGAATPDKPKPVPSSVQVVRTRKLTVSRRRPIQVTSPGGQTINGNGREIESPKQAAHTVPRPERPASADASGPRVDSPGARPVRTALPAGQSGK